MSVATWSAIAAPLFETMATLGCLPEVIQQIADTAANGRGIQDTAEVLEISPTMVIEP